MERIDIAEKIKRLLMEHLGVGPDQVTAETKLCPPDGKPHEPGDGHLGCDSLDIVEITMALEEEFRIEIPDDEAEPLNRASVGDLYELVERKLG